MTGTRPHLLPTKPATSATSRRMACLWARTPPNAGPSLNSGHGRSPDSSGRRRGALSLATGISIFQGIAKPLGSTRCWIRPTWVSAGDRASLFGWAVSGRSRSTTFLSQFRMLWWTASSNRLARIEAVDEDQANLPTKERIMTEQAISDVDARLAARLRQFLNTPGISDKDRKLVERNLQRLLSPPSAGSRPSKT